MKTLIDLNKPLITMTGREVRIIGTSANTVPNGYYLIGEILPEAGASARCDRPYPCFWNQYGEE